MSAETTRTAAPAASARHRPKSFTVFAAAFIAGAAAAVGVNRVLDVQLAQRRPQVECEPIFVALRTLPQGAPVTVWDVALKDWPKAMLPSSALRAGDTFDGYVLRHAVREGQPLLAVQLVKSGAAAAASPVAPETFTPAVPAASPTPPPATSTQADPWMPAESIVQPAPTPPTPVAQVPTTPATLPATTPATTPASNDKPAEVVTNTVATPSATDRSSDRTSAPLPAAAPADDTVAAAPAPAAPAAAPTEPATVPTEPEAAPIAPATAPTIAATLQPMPPSPTDIDPPVRSEPTPGLAIDPDEMAEAVATDVQTMPSVMTAKGQPTTPATRPTASDAGRYLVVPERIALQADTSFTTPRPEPPGPPATVAKAPTATPRPTATGSQSAARRPGQQRPQAGRAQQPQPQKTQSQAASRDQKQAAAPQRTWSGMFPNVAAGIEALGSPWQRSRPADQQAPEAPPQPTRR